MLINGVNEVLHTNEGMASTIITNTEVVIRETFFRLSERCCFRGVLIAVEKQFLLCIGGVGGGSRTQRLLTSLTPTSTATSSSSAQPYAVQAASSSASGRVRVVCCSACFVLYTL
jgi:hypothetical protein